jgi:hypothetical protein
MRKFAHFVAAVAVKYCLMKPLIQCLSVCRRCRAVLRQLLQLLGMRG